MQCTNFINCDNFLPSVSEKNAERFLMRAKHEGGEEEVDHVLASPPHLDKSPNKMKNQ